jgi:DNA-binding MurR/RpiR family transcriptional regulator
MSVLQRVQEAAEALTPAERLLVRQIIASPRDVALGTASNLARQIGVHEATASRLAKKLGYESYAGFRTAIQDEFIVRTDPATRVRTTLEQTGDSDLLSDLISREVEALTVLARYVDEQRLVQAARTVLASRRTFVFARGNAEALAVLLERRLRRMGRHVHILRGDGRDIAEQVLGMDEGDSLVAFVFRRQPPLFASLIKRTRSLGARSIVIAGSIGPSLSPAADHLLFAPRTGSQDAFQTLTVPMAIANALILAMAREDRDGSLRKLESLGELIDTFEGE